MKQNKKGLLQRKINVDTSKLDIAFQKKFNEIYESCCEGGFNAGGFSKQIRKEYESHFDRRIGIIVENYVDIIFDGRITKKENISEILDYIKPNTSHWIEGIGKGFLRKRYLSEEPLITKIQQDVNGIISRILSRTKVNLELRITVDIKKKKENWFKKLKKIPKILFGIMAVLGFLIGVSQFLKDRGKLKIVYVGFIETINDERLSKDTGFELKITNTGNRKVVTDYLIATNKNGEVLNKWQKDFPLAEGEPRNIRVTLAHAKLWVLKQVDKMFIIDTKEKKWYLPKKDTDIIKNKVINLYKKWILPEKHNVDESQFFILREKEKKQHLKQ